MESIEIVTRRCRQGECSVSTTGVCLEGLELSKCSHYFEGEESNDNPSNEFEKEKAEDDGRFTSVHAGDVLLIDDCAKIMHASLSKLIILAGGVDFGKTTLLASLIQLFQSNLSFANYIFAGSYSLIGFEKRCHRSRMASESNEMDTDRTVLKEFDEFLHLKLCRPDNSAVDLLFTDVSGEKFQKLADSEDECKKFDLIKRADHFVLFMDAHLLSELKERQLTKTNSIAILRGLIDSQMLDAEANIQIVFSRWDLLLKKENHEAHLEFINSIKEEIRRKFSNSHNNIRFYEIASRPKEKNVLNFGYGLEKILPDWIENSRYQERNLPVNSENNYKGSNQFLKFKHE